MAWLLLVSKEWGVRPASIMDWSDEEFMLAVAHLRKAAELRKPTEYAE